MTNTLQTKIISLLKENGYYVINTIVTGVRGTPDIIACSTDGKFVGIEVKKRYEKVSLAQEHNLQKIIDNNGIAIVARQLSDVKETLWRVQEHDTKSPKKI